MNTITITGNIGKDATLRQMGSGQYACFSVADTRKFKGADGQMKEKTTWFSCMKSDTNGNLAQYLTKGTKVAVTGRASLSEFVGNDGKQHAYIEVMVSELDFMSKAQGAPQPQPQQYQQPQQPPQRPPQNVKDLYDYATGGQAHNVRQNAPQAQNQANQQDEELPF